MAEEDMIDGGGLPLFESSSDAKDFGNNDEHAHHNRGIKVEEEEGQEQFIVEPNSSNNNNEHHQREHNDLFSKGSKHDSEEDEENPPHAPTGNPATLIEEDQESLLVIGGERSSNIFQLALFQRDVMEAKSTAAKAMKIAIEAKKETKETMKVLEATKEQLSDLTARLENNISHHNNNNRGEENKNNNNSNAPQFPRMNTLLNDSQSQTATLSEDTYSLMMTKEVFTKSWCFGFVMFCIQIILLGLIFHDQIKSSEDSSVFNIPFKVSLDVRISQFLAIFLSIMISYDIFMPIKELSMLWIANGEWSKVLDEIETTDYRSLREMQSFTGRPFTQRTETWLLHILLPLLLKFVQGILVLLITFVIVIQSDDIIDLFKDFAAMQVISEIDNVAFSLASHGFFGFTLKRDSDKAKNVEVKDEVRKVCFGLSLRPVVMVSLVIIMMGTFFGLVVIGQENGTHFSHQYENCKVRVDQIKNITDGKCNGGLQNTFQCGFDGGDCLDFNMAFPNCMTLNAYEVGDGTCQEEHNIVECGYDGGDCCDKLLKPEYFEDGKCNGGLYNSIYCGYDHGDCDQFRNENPLCPDLNLDSRGLYKDDGSPIVLGDGICDFIPEYMTKECGYEFGDCSDCKVDDPSKLGNGICDGGLYNTEVCGFDVRDCEECNSIVDDFSRVGNGVCDGGIYMSEPTCNADGGDCQECVVDKIELVGNGVCNGGDYMSTKCGKDGGDCDECNVEDPFLIGNGICNGGTYNTKECGFDGGDCLFSIY